MVERDEDGRLVQYRGLADSPDCARCPCAANGAPRALAGRSQAVRAFGATGGLCAVGEAPGSEEVYQGYPFVGPSGRLLMGVFKRGRIDRQLVWITNALLCARPKDDAAFQQAVECCRPRLAEELAFIQPTAIIALGGTAVRALQLSVTTITEARGTVQVSPLVPGIPVITTMHPAALFKGGAGEMAGGGKQKMNVDAQMLFLQSDVEKAAHIAAGALDPVWSDDIFVVVEPGAPTPVSVEPACQPEPAPEPDPVPVGYDRAFWEFHKRNPRVYAELVRLTREALDHGLKRIGIRMIWEVMRWNLVIVTDDADFKLNNNYHASYARLVMAQEPDMTDVFELRG